MINDENNKMNDMLSKSYKAWDNKNNNNILVYIPDKNVDENTNCMNDDKIMNINVNSKP